MKIALCLLALLPLVFSAEMTEEEKRSFLHVHLPHFTTDALKHEAKKILNHMKAAGQAVYSHSACVTACKAFAPSPFNTAYDKVPVIHINGICHYVDQLFAGR